MAIEGTGKEVRRPVLKQRKDGMEVYDISGLFSIGRHSYDILTEFATVDRMKSSHEMILYELGIKKVDMYVLFAQTLMNIWGIIPAQYHMDFEPGPQRLSFQREVATNLEFLLPDVDSILLSYIPDRAYGYQYEVIGERDLVGCR